jgi:hypothetical protein
MGGIKYSKMGNFESGEGGNVCEVEMGESWEVHSEERGDVSDGRPLQAPIDVNLSEIERETMIVFGFIKSN